MRVEFLRIDFKNYILLGCLCFFLFSVSACVTTPPPPPEDPIETLNYSFNFTPPEKSKEKHNITIGIVSPHWEKGAFDYSTYFSVKANERLMKPDMQATKGPISQELFEIIKEFDKAVENEFEAMMINRGFNTLGPFEKIDDMTYPQKQACDLVLYPEFSLKINGQPELVEVQEMKGTATLRSEVVLNILEPMSREKLWMKRINLKSEGYPYKYKFDFKRLYTEKGALIGYERNGVTWDNRTQRTATALSLFFSELMDTAWKYFSPEELKVLKQHSEDIRKKKRF